ncbi:MAG: DUF2975 domain-containing protein [Chlorobiaceae bacterium]|nr:DUF2975 domain-containing protein [Chlorobiaceae bacterium]MBA4309202.1 DUF2975 domain-containing protein [Chlorobiaceae bacterium]
MSKRNNFIWKGIQVICWLIFLGYCIQTGALLFNFIFSLFKPIATHNLHLGLDLSELYDKSISNYTLVFALIIAISALKAYVFFIALKLFKSLNLVKPFSENVSAIITKITYLTFSIGIISIIAQELVSRLSEKGYNCGLAERYWDDGGAYLAMTAILFAIALIFNKGIELQKENDLTV